VNRAELAALLEGELQWYGMAVFHMKCYLELEPDAKNAKAAREKMYLWEGKAKEEKQNLELVPEDANAAAKRKFYLKEKEEKQKLTGLGE
jgi:hypothetical protein